MTLDRLFDLICLLLEPFRWNALYDFIDISSIKNAIQNIHSRFARYIGNHGGTLDA
ncbi:MAG: hypothetical protein ACE14P_02525 [Methanotrichaceae archaeon]